MLVHADAGILDAENDRLERPAVEGRLRTVSLCRRVFIAYGVTIGVTANCATAVAAPLEGGVRVIKAERVGRDRTRASVLFHELP